jgi:uncharacterized tellurite resistance protein B-like protein
MFEVFKHFVTEFVDGGKHPSQFADDDYRLAAAALLVHAAAIDGEMSQTETDKLRAVIKHQAVDVFHFTHLLNSALDEEGRARIIEMMWEIVYADGQRDELEDNLLWRAADLLGVSPRERIELRQRIAQKAVAPPGGSS